MILADLLTKQAKTYFTRQELERDLDMEPVACSPCEGQAKGYSLSYKCCTYFPFLANHIVGGFTEEHLEKLSSAGGLITHLGIHPSKQYREQFALSRFGTNDDLSCPMYKGGQCSIWSTRPVECQMYFCSKPGEHKVWKQAKNFANEMEMGLSQLSALYAGANLKQIQWSIDVFSHNESKYSLQEMLSFYRDCHAIYQQNSVLWIRQLRQELEFILQA